MTGADDAPLLPGQDDPEVALPLELQPASKSGLSAREDSRFRTRIAPLLISILLFAVLLFLQGRIAEYLKPPPSLSDPIPLAARLAAARCAALFAFIVSLWASEAIPLYATALSVAPLAVSLRVFVNHAGAPLSPHDAAQAVMRAMGTDAVFMVLGVYTLGESLKRTSFKAAMSRTMFTFATTSLRLLAVAMVLSVAVSMFVSNVFAPVLLLSLLRPVFHALGPESAPLIKSIILGVSVASNIGGMPSPVSSPQNIVARALLHNDKGGVSFLAWLVVTLPQCAIMLLVGFALIVARFRTWRYPCRAADYVEQLSASVGHTDLLVGGTFAVTIFLWITPFGDLWFGKAGVVALIPVGILFGSGVLDLSDFKQLPWNVIFLVAGGTALGTAIESSHLLNLVAFHLSAVLARSSTWGAFCIVVVFMAIVAEGISHTVSAIIVLPLVQKVGITLGHPKLLVMGGVLACSGAMSLPVSSFPNMSAFGVTDAMGKTYLTSADILISGLPMTIASSAVISTIGYVIMRAIL